MLVFSFVEYFVVSNVNTNLLIGDMVNNPIRHGDLMNKDKHSQKVIEAITSIIKSDNPLFIPLGIVDDLSKEPLYLIGGEKMTWNEYRNLYREVEASITNDSSFPLA